LALNVTYTGSTLNNQGRVYVYVGPQVREDLTVIGLIDTIKQSPNSRIHSLHDLRDGLTLHPQPVSERKKHFFSTAGVSAASRPNFLDDTADTPKSATNAGIWEVVYILADGMAVGESLSFQSVSFMEVLPPAISAGLATPGNARDPAPAPRRVAGVLDDITHVADSAFSAGRAVARNVVGAYQARNAIQALRSGGQLAIEA